MRIGFLGGGQLARMMALRAHELGIEPWVLTGSKQDPAAQVTSNVLIGKVSDQSQKCELLFKHCNWITFESEFVDCKTVSRWRKKYNNSVFPEPQTMSVLQDRLSQKELLTAHRLPTSSFICPKSSKDLEAFLKQPVVLKKRLFGYDGYGTRIIQNSAELKQFIADRSWNWLSFIAERWIPFKRELAMTFIRNSEGQCIQFPVVETLQKQHRCFSVKGPIFHNKAPKLAKKIVRMLSQIDYVGAITFELFDLGDKLLINEVAPRVHNSAHWSQLGLAEDQFLLHIKAGLGMKLPKIELSSKGFAMVNLLGQELNEQKLNQLPPNVSMHWYGKREAKPGRKMGHLNALGKDPKDALKLAIKALKEIS